MIMLAFACAAAAAGAPSGRLATLLIDYPSISPNGDGIQDSSPVRITLLERCDTMAATIEEASLVLDTLLFRLDAPAGGYNTSWNGRDSLGTLLPEGNYTLHLFVAGMDTAEHYRRTVIVDVTPPLVQIDRIEPGVFTPGVAGTAESVMIYFLISGYEEGSILTITVTDPEGIPEELPPPGEITGDGMYHVEWPGESAPGDGIHTVSLSIRDKAGSIGVDEGFIDVDIDGPSHGFITQIPEFTREVPPVLEGYCFDRNGVETPELVWNDNDPIPPHGTFMLGDTLVWQFNVIDSVTADGEYIEGVYTLDVTCADIFGHETGSSLTFEIDRTPPGAPVVADPYSPVSRPDLVLEVDYNASETDSFIVYRRHGGSVETTRIEAGLYVNLTLEEGENSIWIEGVDRAGNVGAPSIIVTVVYETDLGFFYPEVFRGPDIFRILTGEDADRVCVDIFTVSGEHVIALKQSGPDNNFEIEWELTNGDGEEVRNGVYLAVVSVFYADTKRVEKNFIAVVR